MLAEAPLSSNEGRGYLGNGGSGGFPEENRI
jgi:hypothetical protein